MVPRLIHHLLRLCAIIVSIVCSTVLTVCAPFHTLSRSCVLILSPITILSFSFSVSSVRLFQFVCQSSFSCDQVSTIPGFQCIISDTSVAYGAITTQVH